MSKSKKITTKEIAVEIVKVIQPKLDEMQKELDEFGQKLTVLEGRIQTLSSVNMNKMKHKKRRKKSG